MSLECSLWLNLNNMVFFWTVWVIFATLGVGTFPVLFYISASYGKFTRPGFGRVISNKTFWIVQESPGLFIVPYYIYTSTNISLEAFILLSLYIIHYINRSIIYGLQKSPYSKTSLITVLCAILFNVINGYLQAAGLIFYDLPKSSYFLGTFWIGIFLWVLGFYGNISCEERLRALRRNGEYVYSIPYGGVFQFVTAANYFTETVEWLGWAIACQNWSGWLFFLWTFANLMPRALSQHKWYLENFKSYAALNRKAYIPFIL